MRLGSGRRAEREGPGHSFRALAFQARRIRLWIWLAVVAAVFALGVSGGAAERPSEAAVPVYVLPVRGTIEMGLNAFIGRGLAEAGRAGAVAVLLEVNTFGGRVDAATEIRDAVFASRLPVHAFVSERAWSAGALVTLAADEIVMAPGSSIGAAEPRPKEEKTVSALRAEFEATAARRSRDPRLAGAMVDASVDVPELAPAGKILTLTADQAVQHHFARAIASDREAALAVLGLAGRPVIEIAPNWAERAVRFLTDPVVSQILLTIGFLGLFAEVMTGGWGVPGTVGLAALSLFFGARILAGLAGWEVILLLVAGLALLMVELFVIPGFGVAGLLGVLAVLASIGLAFADPTVALGSILLALMTAAGAVWLLSKHLRRSGAWERLVLKTVQRSEQGYLPAGDPGCRTGDRGRALTPLRPAGAALINGRRTDVVTEGEFVAAQTPIEVVETAGARIVVRAVGET